MRYKGNIFLEKELTYTQAQKLTKHLKGLQINQNGKIIQWDGTDVSNLENSIKEIIPILKEYKMHPVGTIEATTKDDHTYQIIVIKNMVKVLHNGLIKNIT